jgi:hypothetical protein
MRKQVLLGAVFCCLWGIPAWPQTQVDLGKQTKNVDFSAASATKPNKSGTSLPGTCSAGETFFKTDAPAGQNLYACTSTNTWTVATAPVSSVFGRTGPVTAVGGDYTGTQIANAPAGAIAATNVQAAVNELDTEKAAASHTHPSSQIDDGGVAATQALFSGAGSAAGFRAIADGDVPATVARDSEVQSGTALLCVGTSGTAAYACAMTPTLTAYANGQVLKFVPDAANTGAASLDINGLGTRPIFENDDGIDLDDDDLLPNVPVLLAYCGACNSAAGAWIVRGIVGVSSATDVKSEIDSKQGLLSALGTFEFSNGLSSTVTLNFNVMGTSPQCIGSDDLLACSSRFSAKTLETGTGDDPGIMGVCEEGASPSCITFESPASLANPLGFQFPDAQPSAGQIMVLGQTAGNKTAVSFVNRVENWRYNFVEGTIDASYDLPVWSVFGYSATIEKIFCKVTGGGSSTATVNWQRDDGSPANVLNADLVCDENGQSSCASGCDVNTIQSGEATLNDGHLLNHVMVSVANSPTAVHFNIQVKMN